MPTIRKTMKTINMRARRVFDHCRDLFRGFVSKYQEILTKYSPGDRESTDLFEFPDKTESKYSRCRVLHVHNSYVTIGIICHYGDKSL